MTSFKKLVMCFGLCATLAMPLAGCSGTWQGIKNDWHDVTGSNDDGAAAVQSADSNTAQPAAAQAQPAAEQPVTVQGDDNSPSAYN